MSHHFAARLGNLIIEGKVTVKPISLENGNRHNIIESTSKEHNESLWWAQRAKYNELKKIGQDEYKIGDEYINFEPAANFMKYDPRFQELIGFDLSVKHEEVDLVEIIKDTEYIYTFVYCK
tara:strand:- start:30 stop:392 length:363 start_codon:yes stop_codon:yes gene_type:complete